MTATLISPKILRVEGHGHVRHRHWCPGCNETHDIAVETPFPNGARWSWDGNAESPTFSPSVLHRVGHFAPGHGGKDCWCTYEQRFGRKAPFRCGICHYFIRAGRIEFCGDSTHALSGQTVELPDLPPEALED